MKRSILYRNLLSILISFTCWQSFAQQSSFSEVLDFSQGNIITAYLSCDGYLIDKHCATFRREMPVDEYLRTDGEVLDFSIDGSLIGITNYERGIKNGPSKGYYTNGTLRYEGTYVRNIKAGTWKFYYLNGDLEKIVRYENGTPRLMTGSNEKGKFMVRRGSGAFEGIIMLDRLSCKEYLVSGLVRNGFMDGRWTIKDKYTQEVLYKETYRNGRFIEGKDVSAEDQLYISNPRASFVGYDLLENSYYFSDIPCAESPKMALYDDQRSLLSLYHELTDNLFLGSENGELNGRALVNIELNASGVKDISIHSTLPLDIEEQITNFLNNRNGWNTEFVDGVENRFFILIVDKGAVNVPDIARLESIGQKALTEYEIGETQDGKRVGIWNFYDENSNLELTVDFDKPSVNFFRSDTTKFIVEKQDRWERVTVDRPAMYLGSSKQYKDQLTSLIRYPKEALKKRVQGSCLFSFEINPAGFAENLAVIEEIGHGTQKEIENALNQGTNLWIPALVQGKPVKTLFYVRVSFTFDGNVSTSSFLKPYFLEITITP